MLSLINKYRPDKLDEMIGNVQNIIMLKSFIKNNNTPHSFLFYGGRGLGKTSLARILSNEFDCEIIEINGSNDRSVENIRNVIYQGSETGNLLSSKKNKAFIIDEIHSLTKIASESLLKILEEPPSHVYFFLCTTEPQKLLLTIRSRCCQLELERISNRELYPFLIEISKKENNEISKRIARQIAETSEGYVRDGLSLLEKVLQFTDEEKQFKIACEKIENEKTVIDLCQLLLNSESLNNDIIKVLIDLQEENPESLRKIILSYMQKVFLNNLQMRKKSSIIIDCLKEFIYDYAVFCKNIYEIFV